MATTGADLGATPATLGQLTSEVQRRVWDSAGFRATPFQYHEAINAAIQAAFPAISQQLTSTVTLVAATYHYDLDAGYWQVDDVLLEPSLSGWPWAPIAGIGVHVVGNPGALGLVLERELPTGKKLRILGRQPLPRLHLDDETTSANREFVVRMAAAIVLRSGAQAWPEKTELFESLAERFEAEAWAVLGGAAWPKS
jgi:hypothetical protein